MPHVNRAPVPANARSRRTRAALLAAARAILEEQGFEALSMAAVAARAGVTRRAIYLHFPSRADLVAALFAYVAEAEGLEASTRTVWDAPAAAAALDAWAEHLARYSPRVAAVARAVEQVRRDDPDAAAHRERVVRAQLANCRRLAEWLDRERRLAPPWTVESAADMLWALLSADLVDGLSSDRGWSQEQVTKHLALLFRSTFVREPPASDGASPRP